MSVQNDMQVLGVFSQPTYLGLGDQFDKDKEKIGRHKGKQLQTAPSKKGKTSDTTFGPFTTLYSGEVYTDPGHYEKKHAKENKEKIKAGPFKPSSPSKRSAGLGNYFGTIGKQYEHMVDYDVVKKGDKPKPIVHEKRNMMTSPTKRGGYGFTKTTIGPPLLYDDPNIKKRPETADNDKKKDKKKIIGAPFKSTSHGREFFDSHKNVGASTIYGTDSKVLPPKKEKPKAERKAIEKPFRPSSPPKGGMNSTFTPFPSYMEPDLSTKADYVNRMKEKQKHPSKVFFPPTISKSTPSRSVLFPWAYTHQ